MSQEAFQVSQELLQDVCLTAKYELEEKKNGMPFSVATIKGKGIG